MGMFQVSSSVVESWHARNYIPKFQAKFGIPEEEIGGPKLGPTTGPMSIPIPSKYPHPGMVP